jgi:hypothetical protein
LDFEPYLSNFEGFMAAINKIEFTALLVEEVKSTLNELIGDRAKLLGIVKDST